MTRNRVRRLPLHSYRRMWAIADRLMRIEVGERREVELSLEGVYGVVTRKIRTTPYWARLFRDDTAMDECVAASFVVRT